MLNERKPAFWFFILVLGIMSSCSELNNSTTDTGKIAVFMTDAPACYSAVNVYIEEVQIHYSDSLDSIDWVGLDTKSGLYNLLELQDSVSVLIASESELPIGKITQMRLILADSNFVCTESDTFKMKVPSGTESGLKLIVNDSIKAGQMLELILDFDAEKSVVQKGNGEYQLKPVIKIFKESN